MTEVSIFHFVMCNSYVLAPQWFMLKVSKSVCNRYVSVAQ